VARSNLFARCRYIFARVVFTCGAMREIACVRRSGGAIVASCGDCGAWRDCGELRESPYSSRREGAIVACCARCEARCAARFARANLLATAGTKARLWRRREWREWRRVVRRGEWRDVREGALVACCARCGGARVVACCRRRGPRAALGALCGGPSLVVRRSQHPAGAGLRPRPFARGAVWPRQARAVAGRCAPSVKTHGATQRRSLREEKEETLSERMQNQRARPVSRHVPSNSLMLHRAERGSAALSSLASAAPRHLSQGFAVHSRAMRGGQSR
jgi:hypothetical protein